jgi:hypothetical protein
MKKTFILVAVAAILFAGFANAQNPVWMRFDPADAWEPADFECDAAMEHFNAWVPEPSPDRFAFPCSDVYWTFCCLPCVDTRPDGNPLIITTRAYVNQWMQASFSGRDVMWIIQHPGEFTADTLFLDIMSNGNIAVSVSPPDDDLLAVNPGPVGDTILELMWGEGVGGVPGVWYPTLGDLLSDLLFLEREADHQLVFHLWQKLNVEKCNSVGWYESEFEVTFCATTQIIPTDFLLQ